MLYVTFKKKKTFSYKNRIFPVKQRSQIQEQEHLKL